MGIGIYLRKLRVSRNYTQSQVAAHLNISRVAYMAWEADKVELTFERLELLGKLYGLTAKEIIINCKIPK